MEEQRRRRSKVLRQTAGPARHELKQGGLEWQEQEMRGRVKVRRERANGWTGEGGARTARPCKIF